MKILITGAAGFIGSKIAQNFYDKGHEIFVIDNLSNGKRERINKNWDFCHVNLFFFHLDEIFEEGIDLVIHCAAQTDVRKSIEDPMDDSHSNIYQSLWLMQHMVQFNCKRIIFLSSAGALYDIQDGIAAEENSPIKPICPYGISKRAFEMYLEYFKSQHKIIPTILRLSNVYGRDNEKGVVRIFVNSAINGEPLILNGGDQTRDFIHVDDVVSAVETSVGHEGVYNVGTGENISMNQLAELVKEIFDPLNKSEIIKNPYIEGEVMSSIINANKLKSLGWKPKITIKEGLKTVDNVLMHML